MDLLGRTSFLGMKFSSGEEQRSRVSRRQFVKTLTWGAAFSFLAGKETVTTLLADCQPVTAGDGMLRLTVADFPALSAANGSVRLALNPFSQSGPSGAFYPVLINRAAGDQFYALETRCTHQGCVVPVYNAAQGASVCPCHGSRYAIDGKVKQGPAASPLKSYPVNFDGSALCVEIPKLAFTVSVAPVAPGANVRLKLQFATFRGGSYQVLFRQSPADPGSVVSFAATEAGAASNTIFKGTGTPATVYVDSTATYGAYTVTAQVSQG
jgi:nitrite reductase/ring-hydroxylating ferredoxin subunit